MKIRKSSITRVGHAVGKTRASRLYYFRYDHPDIMAGQGTLGLEIVEQVPDIDAVVVPIGGGGLIAGVALAVKTLQPNVEIIVSYHGN